ncbi:immunity 22 family protein [Lysinibacillus sp. NPDC098008]|uniref:immunity 22 family protein n=1 Tax=Lysinibacillus sp. NPDC098008 TaxID=3364146 RepID=UPI003808D6DC
MYYNKDGYVSIWAGKVHSEVQLYTYLTTVYQGREETDQAFAEKLGQLFLPEHQCRAYESDLKALFDDYYHQFTYDFGIVFDEDFCEALYYKAPSNELSQLIHPDFSYVEHFTANFIAKMGNKLPESYNAVIILYDCHYDGHIASVRHEAYQIDFLGAVEMSLLL